MCISCCLWVCWVLQRGRTYGEGLFTNAERRLCAQNLSAAKQPANRYSSRTYSYDDDYSDEEEEGPRLMLWCCVLSLVSSCSVGLLMVCILVPIQTRCFGCLA